MEDFLNLLFRYNMIPLTKKPTEVTRHSANTIDHIITDSVTGHSDQPWRKLTFQIIFLLSSQLKPIKQPKDQSQNLPTNALTVKKNIEKFKNTLHNKNWNDFKKIEDPNKTYKYFLNIFIDIYDNSFPKTEVKVKFKSD